MNMGRSEHCTDNPDLFAEEVPKAQSKSPEPSGQAATAAEFSNAYAAASQPSMARQRPALDLVSMAQPKDTGNPESQVSPGDFAAVAKRDGRPLADEPLNTTTSLPSLPALPRCAECSVPNDARPRLMTAAEVAEYLRCSVSKIWRLANNDPDFPPAIRIGGSTRWDRLEIDRYIEINKARSRGRK